MKKLKYGFWTYVGPAPRREGAAFWHCKCKCGTVKNISAYAASKGRTKSCGCRRAEATRKKATTHGKTGTAEYRVWKNVNTRCYNPNAKCYKNYGGRGIKVCERWRSFVNFLADMGPRPSPTHSLDRINNSKDYSPENCRWATVEEQVRNKRTNLRLEHDGLLLNVTDWSKRTGLHINTIRNRILLGWTTERALSTPSQRKAD